MTTNGQNVMREDAPAPAGASPPQKPDEQQTVEIPLSAFPMPPKPNAMIQMKVISVDANQKVVNAIVAAPEGPGGSDSLAAEFNQSPPPGAANQMK